MSTWLLRFGVFVAALSFGLLAAYFTLNRFVPGQESFDAGVVEPPVRVQDVVVDEAADERSIYLAVYADEGFIVNRPLIVERTTEMSKNGFDGDPGSIDGAPPDAIADFQSKNSKQISLRSMFPNVPVLGFITRSQLEAIFGKDKYVPNGWQIFKQRFPNANGELSFSRIGFDRDHAQAIVYFAHSCGGLCGHGGWLLYTKSNGAWKRTGGGTGWVS